MEAERRRQIVLAILAVMLAIVVYRAWPRTASLPAPSSNQGAGGGATAARGRAGRETSPVEATDVHLEALSTERPKPGPTERNLFRFREKPPPGSAPIRGAAPPAVAPPVTPEPAGPPPTPPPPPINLKFIGIVEQGSGKPKIAVLSDGSGPPQYGKEGEIVLGRYRILKIGEESIELAYADGRGRQTIRLTGS
jgi:hypothetical protein